MPCSQPSPLESLACPAVRLAGAPGCLAAPAQRKHEAGEDRPAELALLMCPVGGACFCALQSRD